MSGLAGGVLMTASPGTSVDGLSTGAPISGKADYLPSELQFLKHFPAGNGERALARPSSQPMKVTVGAPMLSLLEKFPVRVVKPFRETIEEALTDSV